MPQLVSDVGDPKGQSSGQQSEGDERQARRLPRVALAKDEAPRPEDDCMASYAATAVFDPNTSRRN